MRNFFIALLSLVTSTVSAQHSLQKLWESDTTLRVPESVLPYRDGLYVSLIDGEPWAMDGKGEIAKLDKNGKIVNASWVTGLNAPKGMGEFGKKLFVADVSDVAVVNTGTGTIESRIPVSGATGLNDITVDKKGIVYVSDSKLGTVHRIQNGKAELYLSNLKGVNGLKAVGNDLYILAANDVFKADANKKLTTVLKTEMGGDGIEPVGNGDLLVSFWPGLIFYVHPDGKTETLLDTRAQKKNTADIGYDPASRILYVPTFFKNSVVAYRLN